jgi:RNA-directed DNA polymerase
MTKRMRAKLKVIQIELKQRMHHPIPEQGQWLRMVLRGHNQYYGVPRNYEALWTFRYQMTLLWKRALERRSQRGGILWERMNRLASKYLPNPRICHPYPDQRLHVTT